MANIVQCEKHGLRYNADIQDGCVICRREAGTSPGASGPGASGPGASGGSATGAPIQRAHAAYGAASSSPSSSPSSMAPALLVTGILILGTTGVFFVAHSALAATFRAFMAQDDAGLIAPGMPGFSGSMEEDGGYPSEEYDDYESLEEYDGSDYDDD